MNAIAVTRRAYSVMEWKAVDDDKRIIEGVATTPSMDRLGDIVEPKGAQFVLPIPFLWQHDSGQPIGHVIAAKVTAAGIKITAQIAKNVTPQIDEAWALIKSGLVRGLSIGFRGIDTEQIPNSWGVVFKAWEWLELSAVTIPANQDASIQTIKSIDQALLAASGKSRRAVVHLTSPDVPGITQPKAAKESAHMKTIPDQIKEWEAKRQAKQARQDELMTKSAEAGRTLDDAEGEEHDTLAAEIAKIDEHLKRLADTQKAMQLRANPVDTPDSIEDGSRLRATPGVQIIEPKLEKGIGFARLAQAMYLSSKTYRPVQDIAKEMWPNWGALHQKNVAAGTTTATNWALPLVNAQVLATEFAEYLRPMTIIGQFGTGGIPSLRRVPFNIKMGRQTTKGTAYWVGEGAAKPVTEWQMESITLAYMKAAALCVITEELLRFSSPSAEALVRDELARAVVESIDIAFIDPANAGSANVKPAAITYGAYTVASSGDNLAAIVTDVLAVTQPMTQANLRSKSMVWVMNENVARGLSLMYTTNGQLQFPTITPSGGSFQGYPVIVSQYVPTAVVALVAADEILLADDGNVTLDFSREASLEMVTSSSQTAVTGTGASLVSMFQTNSVAFRAEREITWRTRRTAAVSYLTSANWGGTVGSGDIA